MMIFNMQCWMKSGSNKAMIRDFKIADTNSIMEIWLNATIEAHKFIPEAYWRENYSLVKETYLPSAETFVYEDSGRNKGFISIISDTYIGALFVDVNCQGKGIGTTLLDFAKKRYPELSLAVYSENEKALSFYQRSGFVIEREQMNADSGAKELAMHWSIHSPSPR